ncbi:hypothetical protein NA57DRAFT_67001 [Rhizodiscina lignyota]|uniref:T6SS Phospholipase effector Tle1-like catalytic domain-containing protein n=1 Tax=Rhizodiscina lignyota TaxID=1504668 RepID=A0A9P4M7M5_9PEZI|nr:hypothetical protein NA57DRAFT_67001 [Rhizodiscina lignyota]
MSEVVRVTRTRTEEQTDGSLRPRSSHSRRSSRSPRPPPSTSSARPPRGLIKRLIVACDGTWLNSDNGMQNGSLAIPSNVTRISRAIKSETRDGIQQIVYYQEGVGSEGLPINRFVAGTTGQGLGSNVREGYSFLSNNYDPGDEIFLIGFSRGAFTARSIAGLISEVGLLTKRGLQSLVEVFHDVQHQHDPDYRPKNPDIPFPNKPSARNPAYRDQLYRRGLTDLNVSIKAIGVFDTVGSLGIPRVGWLTKVGLQTAESDRMQFYDTKISNRIENAFQALALDEKRSAFAPAVWEKPPGNRTNLRQVWFPGVHSNIGGGYDDQQLANLTLAWMMAQLTPFLEFHRHFIIQQEEENIDYYKHERKRVRPWGFGKIYDSKTGLYNLGGGKTRTPGQYFLTDPDDVTKSLDRPLMNTHEYMHPSVRTRIRLKGPGVEDDGRYDPEAMDDWKLVVEYPDGPQGRPNIYWKARFKSRNVSTRVLPESPLWDLERELLAMDPETEEYVLHPPPTRNRGGDDDGGSRVSGASLPTRSRGRDDDGPRMSGALPPPGIDDHRRSEEFDDRTQEVREIRGSRPHSTVLLDETDENGRRRVIEEVDADGKKRIVEEKYTVRKRG